MKVEQNSPMGICPRPCSSQISTISRAALLMVFATGLASGPDALAQDNTSFVADHEPLEEIVVTGTRIMRRDFVTPSPLTTLDRDAIDFTGQSTIEETLNQMPQVFPSLGRTSNNPGIGEATVDLRGLGPARTLVLFNGRRVAPSGGFNFTDLNTIPQFLVDRVEIITGGASAVYGSDAIAGVVNFIAKDDFDGFALEATMTAAEPGDAETYDFNVAFGHNLAGGRGNLTVFANHYERDELLADDRDFTRIPYFDDWEGNLVESGSTRIPEGVIYWPYADLGNGPVQVTFNPDGTPREFIDPDDRYNYAPVNYLQVPLERNTLGFLGHYEFVDGLEGYVEATFVRNEPAQNLAPVPAQLYLETNLDNPVLTAEARQVFTDNYACDPETACFVMGRRMLEMGPRIIDSERDTTRLVAGVRGEFGDGWNYDGWVMYTEARATEYWRNVISASRMQQGLFIDPLTGECYDPSNGCVPLNLFGAGNLSQQGADFIRLPDFENQWERTQKLASFFVSGSPVDTWAGTLDVALGVEWRSDAFDDNPDPNLYSNDALGYDVYAPSVGTEEVTEIYAEAVVPLMSDIAWAEYLGLEVGARYSDYKLAGGVWTYKAGGEWQPVDGLRLRAMYQQSARAPNTFELFQEQSVDTWALDRPDPCSASEDPVANGNAEKCVMQGLPEDQIGVFEGSERYPVDFIYGGNPELEPEEGQTLTVGAVIEPVAIPNWSFSVDYFEMEVTDTIGWAASMDVCFDPVNTENVMCDNIERDITGNVSQVVDLTTNLGMQETSGIDTRIDFQAALPDFLALGNAGADLGMNIYWTHLLSHEVQDNPATEVRECAGFYGWPCDRAVGFVTYPKNRVTSNFHYASGAFAAHLSWRWIEGMDNAAPKGSYIWGIPDPDLAIPYVDDEHYLDLGVSYLFGEVLTARIGVNNLLDNAPPMMADAVWSNNTDTGMYDIFGRSYYLTLLAEF
jgi:iron complex outermembrane receptor protein